MLTDDDLDALVRKHGATSYRNRADTQNPAYGFTPAGLLNLLAEVTREIRKQDEALAELREEHAREERERMGLEGALGVAKEAIEAALAAINSPPAQCGRHKRQSEPPAITPVARFFCVVSAT